MILQLKSTMKRRKRESKMQLNALLNPHQSYSFVGKIHKNLSSTTRSTTKNLLVIKEAMEGIKSGNVEINLMVASSRKILTRLKLSERQTLSSKAKCLVLQTKRRPKSREKKINNQ